MGQWYIKIGGEVKGPVDDNHLRNLARAGKITPDTLIRHSDRVKFYPASLVKGLNFPSPSPDDLEYDTSPGPPSGSQFVEPTTSPPRGHQLLECPTCSGKVSSAASDCPHCGQPLAASPSTEVMETTVPQVSTTRSSPPQSSGRRRRHVQTIEKTGKEWKLLMLISFCGMLGGCAIIASGSGSESDAAAGFGGLVCLLSLFGFIFARFGAWWFHG